MYSSRGVMSSTDQFKYGPEIKKMIGKGKRAKEHTVFSPEPAQVRVCVCVLGDISERQDRVMLTRDSPWFLLTLGAAPKFSSPIQEANAVGQALCGPQGTLLVYNFVFTRAVLHN